LTDPRMLWRPGSPPQSVQQRPPEAELLPLSAQPRKISRGKKQKRTRTTGKRKREMTRMMRRKKRRRI